jgi:hypothetical protein
MLRRTVRVILALLLCVTSYALAYGPLFPWSPIQPGYTSISLKRADIVYPRRSRLDPSYMLVDRYVAEAESFFKMAAPKRMRVVAFGTWGDFARFCPIVHGRVGAVTLEKVDVIYVTPILAEKHLDTGEFLRHEITHAIVGNNVAWLRLRRMRHVSWLYEGVPVWFGRQRAFLTQQEFVKRAQITDLSPVMRFDAVDDDAAAVDMRFYYIAWRDFIDYLVQTWGRERFARFHRLYMDDADHVEAHFGHIFGTPFSSAVRDFELALRSGTFDPADLPR